MRKAFEFIRRHQAEFPVQVMCRVLGVSRQAFYAWAARGPSARERRDRELLKLISRIHEENRRVYGAPRIHAELRLAHGIGVGRKRVERLMRRAQISGLQVKKRGKTTVRVPGVRVASDLVLRNFRASRPDQVWAADITYLRSWQGWVYLAAIQDLYSRRIVGWQMADHMRSELVTDALKMAVAARKPAPGLIHHSDQGSQYVSLAFGQAAKADGISRSMGHVGSAYDNSVSETFFATLKKELIHRRTWPTRHELQAEVFNYIEGFYNRQRRHSYLGYLSPLQFESRACPGLETPTQTPIPAPTT